MVRRSLSSPWCDGCRGPAELRSWSCGTRTSQRHPAAHRDGRREGAHASVPRRRADRRPGVERRRRRAGRRPSAGGARGSPTPARRVLLSALPAPTIAAFAGTSPVGEAAAAAAAAGVAAVAVGDAAVSPTAVFASSEDDDEDPVFAAVGVPAAAGEPALAGAPATTAGAPVLVVAAVVPLPALAREEPPRTASSPSSVARMGASRPGPSWWSPTWGSRRRGWMPRERSLRGSGGRAGARRARGRCAGGRRARGRGRLLLLLPRLVRADPRPFGPPRGLDEVATVVVLDLVAREVELHSRNRRALDVVVPGEGVLAVAVRLPVDLDRDGEGVLGRVRDARCGCGRPGGEQSEGPHGRGQCECGDERLTDGGVHGGSLLPG